jgi:hypothetical protein
LQKFAAGRLIGCTRDLFSHGRRASSASAHLVKKALRDAQKETRELRKAPSRPDCFEIRVVTRRT